MRMSMPGRSTPFFTRDDDHAAVGVVLTVEDQSLHGGLTVALRGGNVPHDVLKHSVDVDAVFGGNLRRFHGGDADDVLDLVPTAA